MESTNTKSKRVALVTGAASGIGRGIITRLAADGYAVVGCSRRSGNSETVISLCKQLSSLGADFRYVSADISDDTGHKLAVDTACDNFGRLDVLVNNAGVAPKERRDLLEMSAESLDYVLDVNLRGTFLLTQYAAKRMKDNTLPLSFRAIINITSVSSDTVSLNRGEYCVSKAALSMVTQLFAARLAEYGINVYELRPGIIDTEMIETVRDKYKKMLSDGLAPLGRIGTPEDVAKAISALASGALPYSTGEVINIDGGMHIKRL